MLASGGVTLAILFVLVDKAASAEPGTYFSVSYFSEITEIAQIGAIREVRNVVDFACNSMSSLTIS